MRTVSLILLALLGSGSPLAAQLPTGEFRVHVLGGYAPRVSDTTGFGYVGGPPDRGAVAGLSADLSFIAGRLRLGPEVVVLRGSNRRVWSLGGVARLEFGKQAVRPHGVFSAGGYFWGRERLITPSPGFGNPYVNWESDVNYFTMSLGGGVAVGPPRGPWAFTAEFRAHRSFQSGGGAGARSLLSLGLGGRITW